MEIKGWVGGGGGRKRKGRGDGILFVSRRKVVRYRNVFSGDLKVLIDRFMALVGRLDQMTQN